MRIICHRGYWKKEGEQNQLISFERALSKGYGIETDIRDFNSGIVISHDIAAQHAPTFEQLLQLYYRISKDSILALNIKADGLQKQLRILLDKYKIKNYFVFDMSLPDSLNYLKDRLTAFTRQSEWEKAPLFYEEAAGVFVDCFKTTEWISEELISNHLNNGKKVILVSPELHKRDYLHFWKVIKSMHINTNQNLYICTDFPEEAEAFFNVKN